MKTKRIIALAMCLLVSLLSFTACAKTPVEQLRLIVPKDWEMTVGDSRTVDYVFDSQITNRKLVWSTSNGNAKVDSWGRVTAVSNGEVDVTATDSSGVKSTVKLHVVTTPTSTVTRNSKVDYYGDSVNEVSNLQKIVTRYAKGEEDVPANVVSSTLQKVTTTDGCVWEITDYGVLRTDSKAQLERDKLQRFMGDRYFYSPDTTVGKVLALSSDGDKGVWTVMAEGYTHIQMTDMTGTEKAATMSATTQQYVSRRGMVSEAYYNGSQWVANESDNDGLWTAMYGAGELMRYACLKSSNASAEEIEEARKTALLSIEAVLLLSNVSMRTGQTQAYVRYQPNGATYGKTQGKYLSNEALIVGGDYSANVPYASPSDLFEQMRKNYIRLGKNTYFLDGTNLQPFAPNDWSDPNASAATYDTRVRLLEGFIARTYSLTDENKSVDGNIHWKLNGDGTATGVSTKTAESSDYLLNGENLRGKIVDASGQIPQILFDDLIGAGYDVSDIVYKGDTSSDEIIGHLFIYKLAYDILSNSGKEGQIKQIITHTMDRFAQHIVDNGYMMVDGTGQPTTWSKFNREYFHNSSTLTDAPLTASVALNIFKLASYVTGYDKWENEYRMAATDPAYEYAELMTQYWSRFQTSMVIMANDLSPVFGILLKLNYNNRVMQMLIRMFLNYSDEEMAMLSFYLLFQMEDDEVLLKQYRSALDDWWKSMKYSENPLWYYIYQLAYPDKQLPDAYGNSLLQTASWSLSRHPIDTRKWLASNNSRDDIAVFDFEDYGVDGTRGGLSYDRTSRKQLKTADNETLTLILVLFSGAKLEWKVAAPDERGLHKFNGSTYLLNEHDPNSMEGSTTYTLPYWLGVYHNMLEAK